MHCRYILFANVNAPTQEKIPRHALEINHFVCPDVSVLYGINNFKTLFSVVPTDFPLPVHIRSWKNREKARC